MCNTCGCKSAETFEAKGYKGISASKIQVLEKYIENGGKALDYHELPYHIQRQLEMGKVHELLYQDVNRWLQDNAPNPHHAMPSWLSAEDIFSDKDEAMKRAKELGTTEIHSHKINGDTIYMPFKTHEEYKKMMKAKKETESKGHMSFGGETFEARENKDGTIVLSDAEFNRCRALYNGNYLWYYDELKYIDSGLKQGHKFEKVREYNSQEIALIVQYEKALREQERRLKLRFREQLRDYYGIQRGRNKVNGRIVFDSEGFDAEGTDIMMGVRLNVGEGFYDYDQVYDFCNEYLRGKKEEDGKTLWVEKFFKLDDYDVEGFDAETFEAKGYRNPYAFRKPKLVDTDKYDGHDNWEGTKVNMANEANTRLIEDAPMLLEEVKDGNRIKEYIYSRLQYPSIKKIHLADLIAFIEEDDERYGAEDDLDYYNKYQNYEKNGTPIEKDGYELSWGLAELNRKELIEEILGSFEYDYLLENNMVRKIDDREEEDESLESLTSIVSKNIPDYEGLSHEQVIELIKEEGFTDLAQDELYAWRESISIGDDVGIRNLKALMMLRQKVSELYPENFEASGIDTFTEPFTEMKTGSILKKAILLGSLGVGAFVGNKLRK